MGRQVKPRREAKAHRDTPAATPSSHDLRHANRLTPVGRLPDEVLVSIFAFAGPSSYYKSFFDCVSEGDAGASDVIPRRDCLAFSQVSHHWRELALSTPLLWSTPLLHWPRLATDLLSRSADVPLTVVSHPALRTSEAALHRGLKHMKHIEELDIFGTAAHLNRALDVPRQPASMLKRMHLGVIRKTSAKPIKIASRQLRRLQPFSQLQCLVFTDCFVPPDASIFTNVTSLHINTRVNAGLAGSDRREALANVLEMLRQAPLLETLQLRYFIDHDSLSTHPSAKPVRLEHLARLELVDDARCITAVLNAVGTPENTKLHLTAWQVGDEPLDVGSVELFVKLVAGHVCTATSGPLEDVRITHDRDDYGVFCASRGSREGGWSDIDMNIEVDDIGFAAFLRLVTTYFNLKETSRLELQYRPLDDYYNVEHMVLQHLPSPEDAHAALAAFPSLQKITLVGFCAAFMFPRTLSLDPRPCPNLVNMVFRDVTILSSGEAGDGVLSLYWLDDILHECLPQSGGGGFSISQCELDPGDDGDATRATWIIWVRRLLREGLDHVQIFDRKYLRNAT
jgi:hypothetical protein